MPLNPSMADWRGRTVWLVGASTGIGRATASSLHARGAKVIVSARDTVALQVFTAQHPGSQALPLDASNALAVKNAASTLLAQDRLDCVVYCAGYYREMSAYAMDVPEMVRHWQVNYLGALYVLNAVLPDFLTHAETIKRNNDGTRTSAHAAGHFSLIGSVAGYRGLPKSLAYGPTKAALINLAETLYSDLHDKGIGISLINPGFVDTPLTAQNQFTMPALISPDEAAGEILRGWARGDFEIHFPKRFTYGMKLLQLLPYRASFAAIRRITRA